MASAVRYEKSEDGLEFIFSIEHAESMVDESLRLGDHRRARRVGQAVLGGEGIVGSADDYHNLAVSFARGGDYGTAYEIVCAGLGSYPLNADLLADALSYGSKSGRFPECAAHFETLMRKPYALWNWRSFSFSIEYLLSLQDWKDDVEAITRDTQLALELASEYREYLPFEEKSYLSEFQVRKVLESHYRNAADLAEQPEERQKYASEAAEQGKLAEAALRAAIDRDDVMSAQCGLRYADYLFDRCRFAEAADVCRRTLSVCETQPSVNMDYLMYVNALAEDAVLAVDGAYEDAGRVAAVIELYDAARRMTRLQMRLDNIANRLIVLRSRAGLEESENKTGVSIDPMWFERALGMGPDDEA